MNDEREACITDFGLSRILGESGFTTKSVGGTHRWMAPELLAHRGESILQLTITSISGLSASRYGQFMSQILNGRLPFVQLEYHLAVIFTLSLKMIGQHRRYPEINDNIWSVLERCWHTDRTTLNGSSHHVSRIMSHQSYGAT